MRSLGEFLSGEFLKVKYTRRLSTEYLPELWQVPSLIESTDLLGCSAAKGPQREPCGTF